MYRVVHGLAVHELNWS